MENVFQNTMKMHGLNLIHFNFMAPEVYSFNEQHTLLNENLYGRSHGHYLKFTY